ncbi:MAG: AmmeMemoRadiSam system protein B [Ignavibacteriales bacterium]|nr:AmmeMemoRadiSam system protein B [Ignavibacteriales bacterium]
MQNVRPPAVAGMFYPDSPPVLKSDLDQMMKDATSRGMRGSLMGIISPHAGYMYSGSTAARAYSLLEGKTYDAVIVVGPSHREYFFGISLCDGEAFRTPLGEVPIHADIRSELVNANANIVISEIGHRTEHSVEVQLPFLQRVLGKFSFVPVVMGDQKRELCEALAERLAGVARERKILLVASSDLSHYHPYETAVHLDQRIIRRVEEFDGEGLMELLEHEEAEACGGGPMVAVMMAAKKLGANRSEVLFYCNSGDITGEKDRVVGYFSAALLQVQ